MTFLKLVAANVFSLGLVGLSSLPISFNDPTFAQSAQPTQSTGENPGTVTRFQAGVKSDKMIVLHYGTGITLADNIARILNEDGMPAIAYAGGQPNQIELFVDRRPAGLFTQSDAARGRLLLVAEQQYKVRVLHQPPSGIFAPLVN